MINNTQSPLREVCCSRRLVAQIFRMESSIHFLNLILSNIDGLRGYLVSFRILIEILHLIRGGVEHVNGSGIALVILPIALVVPNGLHDLHGFFDIFIFEIFQIISSLCIFQIILIQITLIAKIRPCFQFIYRLWLDTFGVFKSLI